MSFGPWFLDKPVYDRRTELQRAVDRMLSDQLAVESGCWPQRYILGFDGSKSDDRPVVVEWRDPMPLTQANLKGYHEAIDKMAADLAASTMQHRLKESTMTIDRKSYVTQAVRTPAGSIAQRHIGSLVTITLPSGAEVTDTLKGISIGEVSGFNPIAAEKVYLQLTNLFGDVVYDNNYLRDRPGPIILDAKSVVLVRRPKPPVTANKKGSARR